MAEEITQEVLIDGKVYTVSGAGSEEYFQEIARYLDKKIAEAKRFKPITNAGFDISTLFILINIVDDLLKQKALSEELAASCKKIKQELTAFQDEVEKLTVENMALTEKLEETILNYKNAKNELEDYIENFDTRMK